MNGRSLVLYLCSIHKKWDLVYKAIREKEKVDLEQVEKFVQSLENDPERHYVTLLDSEYPDSMKQIFQPTFAFSYVGDLKVLERTDMILIVGTTKIKVDPERIISVSDDGVISVGTKLKISIMEKANNLRTSAVASALAKIVFIGTIKSQKNVIYLVSEALRNGKNVGCTPTTRPSLNNQLIKEGAMLIDQASDLNTDK